MIQMLKNPIVQDDSQDNSDDDNPFIKYFESQGFFR